MPESAAGTLYIAEKPSLGRAIAEGLGIVRRENGCFVCRNGATVTWCFGHLFEQAEPTPISPTTSRPRSAGKRCGAFATFP